MLGDTGLNDLGNLGDDDIDLNNFRVSVDIDLCAVYNVLADMTAPFPPLALRAIAIEVASLLKSRSQTVCVAETAAGGLISSTLLSLPGASGFYRGGLTLYSLESRIAFAGWTQDDVKAYRGPTEEVVKGLAENVREKLGADYCVCESGTAGPTGGNSRNRTPGYLALAVAINSKNTITKEVETGLGGDREANMVAFADEALRLLRDAVKSEPKL